MNKLLLKNKKFGRLTAIKFWGSKNGRSFWIVQCDCGKKVIKGTWNLVSGRTKSCGCLKLEIGKKINFIHGFGGTRFYHIWHGILKRCHNVNSESYLKYGGRGIKCLWNSFLEFKKDMYKSYLFHIKKHGEKDTTINRINNNGHYSKDNCKWSTFKEQAQNRKTSRLIYYKNRVQSLAAWAEELKINDSTISFRLKNGWSIEKALSTKSRHYFIQ